MPNLLKDSLEAQAAQAQTQNDPTEASRGEQVEEDPQAEQQRSTSWADMMDEDDADEEDDENDKLNMPDWLQQTVRAHANYLIKLDEQCLLEADPAAYLVEARRDFFAYLKRQEGGDLRAEIAALEDPASIGVAHVDEPQRQCTVGRLHGSPYCTAISCEKRDSSLHYESMSEVDVVQTEDDAWHKNKTMEAIDDETAKLFGLPCYDVQQGIDEDAWQHKSRRPVDAARCSLFTTHGTTASLSYDHTSFFGRCSSGIRARSLERPADCVAGSILPLIDRSIWHSEMYRSVD
ncbi:hypothetical protein BCR37DRAFT_385856 [Protomyces lactucae-debilis]|uniref:Uncharacterized protein n=1 Tax=Protomyces lactucae-debilis TaxID=2754530 RepID=A0A1Y2FQZ0_PROLT|nr:uncharacterized protein BCR37DRAFT_385856 [Protomyces lactucae-debilis]ORY86422.1 hypothetical protein BCR37DRAFT_385856 [Protomyces lactucae-debilis]